MKTKALHRLLKFVVPEMPNYVPKGNILFVSPIEHVLQGIAFQSSSFSPSIFDIDVFVQPLYIPSETLTFYFVKRIPGIWEWAEGEEPNLAQRIILELRKQPSLHDELRTPSDIAEKCVGLSSAENPHILEAVAYSLALIGRQREALVTLESVAKRVSGIPKQWGLNPSVTWPAEMLERIRRVTAALEVSVDNVRKLLLRWESGSVEALGLSRFRLKSE